MTISRYSCTDQHENYGFILASLIYEYLYFDFKTRDCLVIFEEAFHKSLLKQQFRENSFRSLPSWLQEAETHLLGDNIPRLIVGNKMDLEGAQQVSRQRAQKFADSNDLPLFEVSSKSDSSQGDINSIFMTIAHKLKQNKPLIPHSRDQVK